MHRSSEDESKGHEFNTLGAKVYMSPWFGTAKQYARGQNLFGDGVYHCVILDLRVRVDQRVDKRNTGGLQWTYNSEHAFIAGVWFGHNVGNPVGYEHLRFWDAEDEAVPYGCRQVGCNVLFVLDAIGTCQAVSRLCKLELVIQVTT